MLPDSPVPPISPPDATLSTPPRKPVLLGIVVLILLVLAAVSVYFFIQQKKQTSPSQPVPTPTTVKDRPILNKSLNCPLASLCQDPGLLYKEGSLSATLKASTTLYAAFAGTAEGFTLSHFDANNKREDYTLLSLSNSKDGLQAMYYLKGTTIQKKKVEVGEVVATSSGQPINFLEGKSFVFIMIPSDPKDGLKAFSAASFK